MAMNAPKKASGVRKFIGELSLQVDGVEMK